MGQGGAWRGGLLLAAFVIIGMALFATVDDSHSGTLAATDQTTTTAPADPPCGGAATVEAAVRASAVGGLSSTSDSYDVTNIRVSTADPTWGSFRVRAKAGQEFQGAYGVVQCTLGWSVINVGSALVGCDNPDAPPQALRSELNLPCPS